MRKVTKQMIENFEIEELGYDFMGYTFDDIGELSFHHLIVPKRYCKEQGLGDGYLDWNGAILKQLTSHCYLHQIERVDRNMFIAITKLIMEEKEMGKIDLEHLKKIREILLYFEEKHQNDLTTKGKKLIKERYITQRIKL